MVALERLDGGVESKPSWRATSANRQGDPAGGRGEGARRAAAGALGLDGGRARARHLRLLGGGELRDERLALNLLDTPRQDFADWDFSEGHLSVPAEC